MKKMTIGDFRLAIGAGRLLTLVSARSFFRCDSNRGQFGSFFEKCYKFGWRRQIPFLNHLTPKPAFVRLFLRDAHLCKKLGLAPGTAGRAVLFADTGSCAPKLPAQDFCDKSLGQSLDNIQAAVAKLLGSRLQFFLGHREKLRSPTSTCRTKITSPNPQSPIKNRQSTAFTILELLVAMAVLAIILVMLIQVVNGLLQSTRIQSQKMDSTAAARQALDVMAMDLQNAVVGENAAILAPTATGTTLFSLITSRRGPLGSSTPRFLAVSYGMTNNQISRSYGSVAFTQTNLINPTLGTATVPVEPLAKGILAVQVRAITETTNFPITSTASANWATTNYNGTPVPIGYQAILTRTPAFSSAFTNTTRALEIWIAAIDEQNAKLIPASYKPSNSDPAAWQAEIDGAGIPAQAKASIRILNKTIPLP